MLFVLASTVAMLIGFYFAIRPAFLFSVVAVMKAPCRFSACKPGNLGIILFVLQHTGHKKTSPPFPADPQGY